MATEVRDWLERDRRRWRRLHDGECRWVTGMRVRPGQDVDLLDLSAGGARVESSARLLPGSVVDVQLMAPGWRWVASAAVVRCCVSAVSPDAGVKYRAALRFAVSIDLPAPDHRLPEDDAATGSGRDDG